MTIRKYLDRLEECIDRNLGLDSDVGDMLNNVTINKDGITFTLNSSNTYTELYNTLTKQKIKSNGLINVKELKEIRQDNTGEYIIVIREGDYNE